VPQKGFDILAEIAGDIVREGGQIAMLGLGDHDTDYMMSRLARSHYGQIALLIGFNEPMARRILAASDFFLIPSRFEPCGLTQMQAQRYGALPVAHATGGLADTIEDGVTGFLFSEFSGRALRAACRRAFGAYADPPTLDRMRRAAMARRFSWAEAAEAYEKLHDRLLGRPAIIRSRAISRAVPRKTALREKDELRATGRVNLAVPALRRG